MIPEFDKDFFLIVNQESKELAAFCLSYISKIGIYTPLFEFPIALCKKTAYNSSEFNEYWISHSRATEFNIRAHNNLKRLRGTEHLLLIGLTDEQLSYLDFQGNYNAIEIASLEDAELLLSTLTDKTEYYPFDKTKVEESLYNAIRLNRILSEDVSIIDVPMVSNTNTDTLVVVESVKYAHSIVAVNFANSMNSRFVAIDKPELSKQEVKLRLQEFREEHKQESLDELTSKIYPSIEHITLTNEKWVTFFTMGIPYSLVTGNPVPISYVNLNLSPDFFIFNNIYYERKNTLYSSIVFSPLEFADDEETIQVIKQLQSKNHFVIPLIGKDANVYNLDMHIQQYPFSVLHICSHGGEVGGYAISEEFNDRNGVKHVIEYDEVVSFAPNPYEKLIPVTTKHIWRKFDGMEWKSDELRNQKYPHYVFSDMLIAVRANKNKHRIKKENIANSCSIKCSDFVYQGMFNHLAGDHFSPFVFNNTCWSWSGISDSFLSEGGRGYIGTLWDINNSIARKTAEDFYIKSDSLTIIDSLFESLIHSKGTSDENIYIFWGLPFSTISKGNSKAESFKNVLCKLSYSIGQWKEHKKYIDDKDVDERIDRLISWCQNTIVKLVK